MATIVAFTDASFCDHSYVAVIGFRLHYSLFVLTELITTNSSIIAEIEAILMCIEYIQIHHPDSSAIIYSDSMDAIRHLQDQIPGNFRIELIRSHTKGPERTANDRLMKSVDCQVRAELRAYLRSLSS